MRLPSFWLLTVVAVAVAFTCCCSDVVHAATYNFNNNQSAVISNVNVPDGIQIIGASNARITIGPAVITPFVQFLSLVSNSTVVMTRVTVNGGEVVFASLSGSGTSLTVDSCTLSNRLRITGAGGVALLRITNNIISIVNTNTVDSCIEAGTTTATTVDISGNALAISTAQNYRVMCTQFQPSALTVTDFVYERNTCDAQGPNPSGLRIESPLTAADTVSIMYNRITATGSASAVCVAIEDMRAARTEFSFSENSCTASSSAQAIGLKLATTQSVAATLFNCSHNAITVTGQAGTTGSAGRGLDLGYVLRPDMETIVSFNRITARGNRDSSAVFFGGGAATGAHLDFLSNTVTVDNEVAGTVLTGVLAIAQGAAVVGALVIVASNSMTVTGAYGPGFIGVTAGQSLAGNWLFTDNTMVRALASTRLISPAVDMAGGNHSSSAFTVRCSTFNGTALVLADATASISNAASLTPTVIACGTCSWNVFCNTNVTLSPAVASGTQCLCRCRAQPDRLDGLPLSTQCIGAFTTTSTTTSSTTTSTTTSSTTTSTTTSTTLDLSNKVTDAPATPVPEPVLSTGAMIGVIVGGVCFLILLVIIIWCCCRVYHCCCYREDADEGDRDRELDACSDISLEPAEPLELPDIKTVTDIIAEAEMDGRLTPERGAEDGELAPSRPANPYLILSLPYDGHSESPARSHAGGGLASPDPARTDHMTPRE